MKSQKVLGTIRKMLKAENACWEKYSTLEEVRQKVSGHPDTIRRSYNIVVAEIKEENKVKKETMDAILKIESIVAKHKTEGFKIKAFYYSALAFFFGFMLGALLLIL